MAERTVNVTINYKVNTVEVQKAQAASQAAQKATDDLRKATEQYGKAAVSANRDAAKSTQDLTRNFNDLTSSVKLVLTGGLAKELVDVTLQMAKLSGQIEGVNRAFSRLPNATLLLDDLRKATHGTVTDIELMQKALMAQNFKIPLQSLGKLFEFAATKAQQTGQEVNHLVNFLVSGIGYRQIKRLDDLGFTANRLKEALGGVSLQAASMGEIMTAVTTLMNEDLQKTGGYAETAATQVEQLETKWTKLKTTVSGILTSPAVLTFYQNVLDLLNRGADVLAGKGTENAQKSDAIKEAKLIQERVLTKEILKDKQKTYDVIQQEANTLQQNIGRNNDELKALKEKRTTITDSGRMMNYQEAEQVKEINKQIQFYEYKNGVIKETIKILNEYNESVDLTTEGEKEQLGIIERKKQEIENLQNLIDTTNRRGDLGASGALIVKLKKAQGELDELLGKSNEKKKKDANEVQEYLAYLSDLELFQDKKILEERIKQRHDANEKEIKDAKEAADRKKEIEEDLARHQKLIRRMLADAAEDILQQQTYSLLQKDIQEYDDRINYTRDFYDEQIELAGDNEKAKKELRVKSDKEIQKLEKERADREKKAAQAGILVNTALGIVKAFATAVTVYDGIIQAAIVAGEGASQYAIASRARYYAKGQINIKGPGTETSDSIPAYLSRGESVITAQATRKSMGLLDAIQNNKIDDRILKQIDLNGGRSANTFSDERIIELLSKIEQKKAPDLVRQGRTIYEAYKDRDGNKRFIRSKSI